MTLRELEAEFYRYVDEQDGRILWRLVETLAQAHGVMFLCPKCYQENGGAVGTHRVICWSRSRGVPDEAQPKPGRWPLLGTGLDDLTLDGDPPGTASVLLTNGCGAHFFVKNGEVC